MYPLATAAFIFSGERCEPRGPDASPREARNPHKFGACIPGVRFNGPFFSKKEQYRAEQVQIREPLKRERYD